MCPAWRVEEFSIQSVSPQLFLGHLVITMTGVMPHCGSIYQCRSFHAKFSVAMLRYCFDFRSES